MEWLEKVEVEKGNEKGEGIGNEMRFLDHRSCQVLSLYFFALFCGMTAVMAWSHS